MSFIDPIHTSVALSSAQAVQQLDSSWGLDPASGASRVAVIAFQEAMAPAHVAPSSTLAASVGADLQSFRGRIAASETPVSFRARVEQEVHHIETQVNALSQGNQETKISKGHALVEYIQAGVNHYYATANKISQELKANAFGDPVVMLRLQRLMAEVSFTIDFFSKIAGQISSGLKTLLQNQ